MAGRTIKTNLELRLRGWKAALKSRRTPSWLKPSLRKNIRELRRRLRKQRGEAVSD